MVHFVLVENPIGYLNHLAPIDMTTDGIPWSDVGNDWIGFLGLFTLIGAIGFRTLVVARVARGAGQEEVAPRAAVLRTAAKNAAVVGIIGAVVRALSLVVRLATQTTEGGGQGRGPTLIIMGGALVLALLGFFIARVSTGRASVVGWILAGISVAWVALGGAISAVLRGRWFGVVNPLHATFASLWLGTLLVLVIAGLPAVLHRATTQASRGPLVADLVNTFSPVALSSAALVGGTGVLTAWRQLKYLSALWTTSYGLALVVKLCLVGVVLALGAWNWRRMRPTLGTEPAARAIRRSSTAELGFGALVLVVTAILVNLPAPKLPTP